MSFGSGQNIVPFPVRTEARAILQARDPSVLQEIGQPGIGAVIWQRRPLAAFSDWINALPVIQLPSLRSLVAVGAVEDCVQAACDLADTPRGRMRDMLASDISALAFIMSEVMRAPLLHVRLSVVTTDACRRFHIDNVSARMLCTYRGAGTQLAQPGQDLASLEIPTGSAALLRGALWRGPEATGLLHRSPPIAGTWQSRLLLAIDPGVDHRSDGVLH